MPLPHKNGKPRACAECRRLKLRCDRNFPCQACVRRGCSSICPDKCFTDKPTPSSLKANTLRSREQIQSLEARITALEKALAQENPSHPLISPASSPSTLDSTEEAVEAVEEAADILGTLAITEDGSTVFHCPTRCPELNKPNQGNLNLSRPPLPAEDALNLPPNLQLLSALFPFTPHSVASAANADDFLPFLPPAAEAFGLITRYWTFCSAAAPISEAQFMKHVHHLFYPDHKVKSRLVREDSHRLALLFIVLAIGAIIDCENLTLSSQAERYHQLSRAALSLDPVCDNTTVPALQCMLFISWYNGMASTGLQNSHNWAFHGVTLKLATSIGIFRDSRKWITDPDEIQQREMLCWELISKELWMAFSHGRPSSVDLSLVDCPRPSDASIKSSGIITGYYTWRYASITLIHKTLLVVLRQKAVRYSEVMALDQQLRDCAMPPVLEVPLHGSPLEGVPDDTALHMQRFTVMLVREHTSCVLHRRFLVLAMENESVDLLDTPFRYSVLRTANSARWIIASQIIMYRRYPKIISRWPKAWSVSFSAAIILGAISARYADRDYAQCTLVPFESICALFAETAGTSMQPTHALESLKRLHKRVTERSRPNCAHTCVPQNCPSVEAQRECLGMQFAMKPPSGGKSQPVSADTTSSFTPAVLDINPPAVDLFSGNIKTSIEDSPDTESSILDPMAAAWPAFDPTYPVGDGGVVMDTLHASQTWESPPDGDILQLDVSTIEPSIAGIEQWDQFLDSLGV